MKDMRQAPAAHVPSLCEIILEIASKPRYLSIHLDGKGMVCER